MQITPINCAEAIIDPFWDPRLSELPEWTVKSGDAHGLEIAQEWCFVTFGWTRPPESGPALSMHRAIDLGCANYDGLVLSVMAPRDAVVRLSAETDRGRRDLVAPPAGPMKTELVLDLEGASRITAVRIEIDAAGTGIEQGWMNWLGLRHSGYLARMIDVRSVHDPAWPKHLKGDEYEPAFRPVYGLLFSGEEIETLRMRHDELVAQGAESPFLRAAERAKAIAPESLIHDYVNFWGDTRYNRERDHGKHILTHGVNAAIAGYLTRDTSLLRLAARYALSIAMCDKWDDGFICFFPGSDWEHRCFVQSLCAYDVAAILDLAGEFFTDEGRDFLLRRLAEEGIASIYYTTWKHDYIYGCNQLAWFTPGRMLALAVLARHYPRVEEHIGIAYRDLCESLGRSILGDGGYAEGPSYFACVGRDGGLGIYHYSRATGIPMEEAMPEAMAKCGDFGEVVASTDSRADVIPICDAGDRHDILSMAVMASVLPESAWARMLEKRMRLNGGWPVDPAAVSEGSRVPMMSSAAIAWILAETLEATAHDAPAVLTLPEMGPVISVRSLGDHTLKLLIQGNKAGAGHTHEDKGSFVVELAGETLAMDPGTCDYSSPLASVLKQCERHNMLVPTGVTERPHPSSPLEHDVKARAAGDAQSFHAAVDLTPGWERYFNRWQRRWDSPAPNLLEIIDEYELVHGNGVEFYWQTRLDVEVDGATATVSGERAKAVLESPAGTAWRIDELPLLDGTQRGLALPVAGRTGRCVVMVRFEVIADRQGVSQ